MTTKPAEIPENEHKALMLKVSRKLLPLLVICYVIAYIDRINIGFAKLQLRSVLGVDENLFGSIYGLGAGLFFIGYFLFEIPSNLILQRVGARIWITRIMITWGLVAISMMFIRNTTWFYSLRFLLGVAEAGFYPGVVLYLTYWFPAKERAKTIALFALGGIIAGIIGSPVSGLILELDGLAGLHGWQWLFLIEGAPAILLGMAVFVLLPDNPMKAKWLNTDEKNALTSVLNNEKTVMQNHTHTRLKDVLTSRTVWLLCLICFLLNAGGYGYELWMPSIINSFKGLSFFATGMLNAVPYLAAALAMYVAGRHSDKTGERKYHVFTGALISAAGFMASAWFANPFIALLSLTIAFSGLKASFGPFWALSTSFLSGTAAAGGIAFINSVGNLGGFAGPLFVGYVSDKTGNSAISMFFLGFALLAMGLFTLLVGGNRNLHR